jgi:hypothetical protein
MSNDSLHTRAIAVKPNSFDPNTRTFTAAVLATSRPIRVRGGIEESLDLAAAQLPEFLPLLLDHKSDIRSTVGRVNNLRISGDELLGDGKLTSDPSLDWLASRIGDGTVGSLSVAYTATASRVGSGRSRTVVPKFMHAALVSEPADDRAGLRSADDGDDDRRDDDLQTRNARIRSLCRTLGLGHEIEERAIDAGWTDERIMHAVLERSGNHSIRVTTRANGLDEPETYRRAMVDAIVAHAGGSEPVGVARELAGLSWPDLHRRHLRQSGQSATGSDAEVIVRALSTSDMPIIAGAAVNVALRRTYDAALSPMTAALGSRTLPDFRPQTEALVDWTTLNVGKVAEMGEFKSSYVTESGETITLYTIGGITGVSRQLWINGAGAIRNLSESHGRRLAADVSDRMVAFLEQDTLAGPKMADTYSVFDSTHHGNILDLDTTDVDTVIGSVLAARAAASKRKGAGNVMIGVTPSILIVESTFEPTAIRALATVAAAEVANVNPLAGRLQLITDPRLSDPDTSYLVASPAQMDGMVKVSLAGNEGPFTESRWGFEIDAVQFKIRLDIGFAFIEHRSWTRLDHGAVTP